MNQRDKMILVVNLNGTLTKEVCWTEKECLDAMPRTEVIEKLRKIFSKYFIVVLVNRKIELATPTWIWLNKHNVPFNAISFKKIPPEMYKAEILAIDIDGTLTKEVCWTEQECLNAAPQEEVIEFLRKEFSKRLVIPLTARRIELATSTLMWLNMHDVPFHAISFNKMPADWYIDDKCTNVKDLKGGVT